MSTLTKALTAAVTAAAVCSEFKFAWWRTRTRKTNHGRPIDEADETNGSWPGLVDSKLKINCGIYGLGSCLSSETGRLCARVFYCIYFVIREKRTGAQMYILSTWKELLIGVP